ncbi:MAG: flagellar motor switch phosphatase FliY [Bacillota bacterium]
MSEDEVLSQEEIDALMNNKTESTEEGVLSEKDKDILGEIGNISMGSAATALYNLLDREVNITTPEVEVINFGQLSEDYERPCVMVKVNYIEGIEGFNILIIDENDARVIADLMMGGDGTNQELELDEIHLSAVGEAMNQMMGSSATAMSSIINEIVNISPPEPEYLELDEVVENEPDYFDGEETVVSVSFQLKIGDLIDSSFKQILPIDFTRQLIKRLSGSESGLTAKDEDSTATEKEQVSESGKDEVGSSVKDENISETKSSQSSETSSRAETAATSLNQKKQTSINKETRSDSNKNVQKEEVGVKAAQFPNFDQNSEQAQPKNMELIKDVPLEVTVRLGKTKMTIKDILDLGEGSIIELDKLAGEPVDLLVNGKLIAKGEVVVIDENFGFRVKDIVNPLDRLNNI